MKRRHREVKLPPKVTQLANDGACTCKLTSFKNDCLASINIFKLFYLWQNIDNVKFIKFTILNIFKYTV